MFKKSVFILMLGMLLFSSCKKDPVQELESMRKDKSSSSYSKYKEKYFEYYDDVKDRSLKKQDW